MRVGCLIDLVLELSHNKLAVEAGDVGDAFVLGAYSFASAGVGAVAETEFVHLGHHGFGTFCAFYTTLGKEGELRHLRGYEEHGRTILTSGNAGTATDAGGAIHRFVGIGLRNEDGIGVLCLSGADGGVTACGLDLVESGAIDHAVLDDGEGGRTPRFNGDDIAIVETAHIELAGGGTALGFAVGRSVDVERAHTADAFAAVVVEDERLFAVVDEFFVEDVEHFEEARIIGDVLHLALFEMTSILRTILLPVFYCERYILCHCFVLLGLVKFD